MEEGGSNQLLRFHQPKCNTRAKLKLKGEMHTNEKRRQSSRSLRKIFVAGTNVALAVAHQHHDQVPAFYRLKVGDLEVTALLDGPAVVDLHWLNGEQATLDGVVKALHEDPHMLDAADTGFLVNTGKQLILVDAGSGTWFGGGAYGHLVGNLRSAGYTPEEVDLVLVTHLHSDHIGGYTWNDNAAGGTTMRLRNRGEPVGFAALVTPVMAGAMRRANQKDLARLKAILEKT